MSESLVEQHFSNFKGVRAILDAAIDGEQPGRVVTGAGSSVVVHDEGWFFLGGEPEPETAALVRQGLERPEGLRLYYVPVTTAWREMLATLPLLLAPRHYFERKHERPPAPALGWRLDLEAFSLDNLEAACAFRNVRSAVAAWGSKERFIAKSLGFGIFDRSTGALASAAFGYAAARGRLELSVATDSKYQGQGLAYTACDALMRECAKRSITPDWNCFTDNEGSAALAKKLGYEPVCKFEMFIRSKPHY